MKTLRFYKIEENKWYVDLPNWTGSITDLEMVEGADIMLDMYSNGGDNIFMTFSETEYGNSDKLVFIRKADELENGAFYTLKTFRGKEINLQIWLCDVTLFVFNDFPKVLYISCKNK